MKRHTAAVMAFFFCWWFVGPTGWRIMFEVVDATTPSHPMWLFNPIFKWVWTVAFVVFGAVLAYIRVKRNTPYQLRSWWLFVGLFCLVFKLQDSILLSLSMLHEIPLPDLIKSILGVVAKGILFPSSVLEFPRPIMEVTLPSLFWTFVIYAGFLRRALIKV
jgi:hypothetical protein